VKPETGSQKLEVPYCDLMRPLAALAGTVGPLLFLTVLLVEGAVRPGYQPLRDTISQLSLGPRGWIQTANFLVFGMLFLIFARGVRASLAGSRAARAGSTLLFVIGAGVLGCGVFQAEPWPPSSMSPAGLAHLVCAMVLVFALLPVATGVMTRAVAGEAHWRALAPASGLTSLLTLGLLVGGLSLMSPPGRPARIGNDYAGLIQRVDVAVFLAWQVAVARRISRTSGDH
jgi:hypothetical protein